MRVSETDVDRTLISQRAARLIAFMYESAAQRRTIKRAAAIAAPCRTPGVVVLYRIPQPTSRRCDAPAMALVLAKGLGRRRGASADFLLDFSAYRCHHYRW